jgi:thiol:disulfide interchange protein DsbA
MIWSIWGGAAPSKLEPGESVKRHFAALILALIFAAPVAAEPMEGVDYALIEQQPVSRGGKIEVIEFFYYGCESCYRFEPALQAWLKTLPADVSFQRVPALRRLEWVPLTKLYFALEELGELDRLHGQVYNAVHESDLNLGNSNELLPWAEKQGLTRTKVEQALAADSVAAKVQKARDTTVAYGVRATPSLVVEGRYLTSGGMVGSVEALLPVVDALIEKARKERGTQ